jgi:hypothetical protein
VLHFKQVQKILYETKTKTCYLVATKKSKPQPKVLMEERRRKKKSLKLNNELGTSKV